MNMRFLFEFVSCCVPINRSYEKIAPPHAEEMRSLTPETTRKHRRRRRNASNSHSSATVIADWKPSLGAIAEDKVVVVVMEREKKSGDPTVDIKRKSGSRESRLHHDRNNFGRSPGAVPVMIPAFSPTPFLF